MLQFKLTGIKLNAQFIVYCQYMSVFLSIKCLSFKTIPGVKQDPNAQRANGS